MQDPNLIQVTLQENRVFPPPAGFAERACLRPEEYEARISRGLSDPEGYWAEAASSLEWFRKWDKVLEWKLAPRPVVPGRQAQCLDQLPGSASSPR